MELYLLKFSACLLVFWLLYIMLLEKQQMHSFKRFYLLGSFVFALVIPQLTITEYVEPMVQNFEVSNAIIPIETKLFSQPAEEPSILTLETVLWTIYALGVLLFSVRFAINLYSLYKSISKNSKYKNHNFIYVLLKEYRIPHSFFKYIFVNKYQFEDGQIPEEVKLHEETHAKQWHSLDILLLELLQILFWFHPLVYILKHHVKLNHEFLADEAVLQQGVATKSYQNILLQFSSNTQDSKLASAINYSSFKKRFTVMKTQTSKTRIWLSTFLVLPILAILFYSFAEREYVEKAKIEKPITETDSFLVFVEKTGNTLELRCESGCKWNHLVLEPKSEPYIINDYGFSEGNTLDTDKFAFSIEPNQSGVLLYGLKGTAWVDLAFSLSENQKQAVNQLGMSNETVDFKRVKRGNNEAQQKATKEQIKNYNTWAKKMNTAIKKAEESNSKNDYPIIKKKEYDKYYNIYRNLMSEAQRANAEAWPNIPPPPPPPPSVPEPPKTKKSEGSNGSPINASKQKKLPVIYVNEKESIKGHIALTKEELKKLKLTLSEGNVTNFKLKIPGIKTDAIQGNTISATSIKNLDNFDDGMITIFDIKDEKENRLPPIIIQLKK